MAHQFRHLTATPQVLAAQEQAYGRSQDIPAANQDDQMGGDEAAFISTRTSCYMGTVSETGWPYIQHRGGSPGFLRLWSPTELILADFKGNRQLLSTGNLAANDRICLFLMDYPRRERLKILGHARVLTATDHPEMLSHLTEVEKKSVERILLIRVVGYDWNCPKYITPRYTAAEVERLTAKLTHRIIELETQLNNQPSKSS